MSKPREWWINPVDNGCRNRIQGPCTEKDIHVIEYSAYEQAVRERNRCREALERIATDTLREFEWVKIARQALKADEGE